MTTATQEGFRVEKGNVNYSVLNCLLFGVDRDESLWARHSALECITHGRPNDEIMKWALKYCSQVESTARILAAAILQKDSTQVSRTNLLTLFVTSADMRQNAVRSVSALITIPSIIVANDKDHIFRREDWNSLYQFLFPALVGLLEKEQKEPQRTYLKNTTTPITADDLRDNASLRTLSEALDSLFTEDRDTYPQLRNEQIGSETFRNAIRKILFEEKRLSKYGEDLSSLLAGADKGLNHITVWFINEFIKRYESSLPSQHRILGFIA